MKIEQELKSKHLNILIFNVVFSTLCICDFFYISYCSSFLGVKFTIYKAIGILFNVFLCSLSIQNTKENYQKIINF